MRHRLFTMILAPAIVLAAACSKDKPAADASLNSDLTLAAQARQNATLDSISAAERLNGGTARAPGAPGTTTAAAPVATTHRTRTHRARTYSGGNVSAGHEVTVKHTKRDAAIGAAAGAAIGAAAGHSVKGGLIGAAAGGILGGIIGNNVDKEKKRVP
ncbi:MAG TPA: glycine zipper domain-containing protein [Gemmatimonadaceae bacterium]